ncbi:MAG: hypothetical protein AVDCRST_MAG49-2890, partial [uncultured Thermomicrobiales bacterium]
GRSGTPVVRDCGRGAALRPLPAALALPAQGAAGGAVAWGVRDVRVLHGALRPRGLRGGGRGPQRGPL